MPPRLATLPAPTGQAQFVPVAGNQPTNPILIMQQHIEQAVEDATTKAIANIKYRTNGLPRFAEKEALKQTIHRLQHRLNGMVDSSYDEPEQDNEASNN